MAQPNRMYGLSRDKEVDPSRTQRDIRRPMEIFADALSDHPAIAQVVSVVLLPVAYFSPTLFVLVCVPIALWFTGHPLSNSMTLPLVLPEEADMEDMNDPKPTRKSGFKARGRIFLGNARFMRKPFELWQGFTHALQHEMVFGTTGAGKTETLVSDAANYLAAGSGVLYSDAKAAPKLGWQIFTLCRFFGREDDFRTLNYIKGNTAEKKDPATRQSHTVNLFAYGSSDSITQIIISIMPPGGGENKLFSERAIGLIDAVMPALVDLRDRVGLLITPDVLRKNLEYEQVEKLKKNPDITRQSRESIRAYLASLAGYKEDPGIDPRTKQPKPQPDEIYKQFGYAQSYFTRALSSLSDTYSDIYMVGHGEINFLDMVLRRRTGTILIPAIEKAPEEQKNLSKIVLAAQKNAISTGIPPEIEGTREEVLETLPMNAPVPYRIINDEFAFMMTSGYGQLLGQSRSLFVAICIAGQDYAGMKREDEDEAEQIAENTKTKIVMASEGLGDTAELVRQIAGEGIAATTQNYTRETGSLSGTYDDGQTATFERRSRVDTMDTRGQIEGEAIMFWRDKIIPFQTFFHGLDDKSIISDFRISRLPDVQEPTRGYAYERKKDVTGEQKAIRDAVRYGASVGADDIGLGDDFDFLLKALDQADKVRNESASTTRADQWFYGAAANALGIIEQAIGDTGSESIERGDRSGSMATRQKMGDEAPHQPPQDAGIDGGESPAGMNADAEPGSFAAAPDSIDDAIAGSEVGSPESPEHADSDSSRVDAHETESASVAPSDDDAQSSFEDELPPADEPASTEEKLTPSERAKLKREAEPAVSSAFENTTAHRVLSNAPWVLDPSLVDDVADRPLGGGERETMREAADAVTRIESASGASEDQAHAIGVTTADAVGRNVKYPSSDKARMPEPNNDQERAEIVERNSRIFGDWLSAAGEDESSGEEPEW